MGFNARLAPFSVVNEVNYQTGTQNAAFTLDHFLFRFPFAGQLIGAYAHLGQGASTQDEDDKTTNLYEVSLWKNSADNTTATYATADRAAKRTGEPATTAGSLTWALNTVYTLSNLTAARRKFGAGDKMYLRTSFNAATDHAKKGLSMAQELLEIQMDYIIGYEA